MKNGAGGAVVNAILRTLLVVLPAACSSPSHTSPANKSVAVQAAGFGFQPSEITIAVGDTVKFHNADMVPHNVSSDPAFDSDSLKPGGDWQWVADKTGRIEYLCRYHPTMKGTIIVE
jgi:plastocyanin